MISQSPSSLYWMKVSDIELAMSEAPNCPECDADSTYQDGNLFVCPMCSYEWSPSAQTNEEDADNSIKDAHGNALTDGDTVTVIKELKIKGSNSAVKVGTKVKGIRLNPDSDDGHDIDCKIPGFGAMGLKSEFVKKSK